MDIIEIDRYIRNEMLMWRIQFAMYEKYSQGVIEPEDYMDVVKTYVPYEIYRGITIKRKMVEQNKYFCQTCKNRENFIKDGEEIICKKCRGVVIQYISCFKDYNPRCGCLPLLSNTEKHFMKTVKTYACLGTMKIETILLDEFKQFFKGYNELGLKRKNCINHELVLYVLLRRNNVNCSMEDFKRLKKCHIGVCSQVLEKLGWENYFLL